MQARRKILMGLGLHFLFWWVVSVGLWTGSFGGSFWVVLSPVAPIYLGIFYLLTSGIREIGACSILAVMILILLTVMAWQTRRIWVILLAHLAVIVYWFFSFVLIAAGA